MFAIHVMKSRMNVAGIVKIIPVFADTMTIDMKKSVMKHFSEYLLGILILTEIRRRAWLIYRPCFLL